MTTKYASVSTVILNMYSYTKTSSTRNSITCACSINATLAPAPATLVCSAPAISPPSADALCGGRLPAPHVLPPPSPSRRTRMAAPNTAHSGDLASAALSMGGHRRRCHGRARTLTQTRTSPRPRRHTRAHTHTVWSGTPRDKRCSQFTAWPHDTSGADGAGIVCGAVVVASRRRAGPVGCARHS